MIHDFINILHLFKTMFLLVLQTCMYKYWRLKKISENVQFARSSYDLLCSVLREVFRVDRFFPRRLPNESAVLHACTCRCLPTLFQTDNRTIQVSMTFVQMLILRMSDNCDGDKRRIFLQHWSLIFGSVFARIRYAGRSDMDAGIEVFSFRVN